MIKLVDQLSAMGSFPIATAQDIVCSDNIRLQEKIDNGTLNGGGGSNAQTITQSEYDALDEQVKLEGEFYCYDSGRHFRNGVEYGKDGVQISDNETVEDKTWSSQKTSSKIAEVETELNAKLGDKADKTELDGSKKLYITNTGTNIKFVKIASAPANGNSIDIHFKSARTNTTFEEETVRVSAYISRTIYDGKIIQKSVYAANGNTPIESEANFIVILDDYSVWAHIASYSTAEIELYSYGRKQSIDGTEATTLPSEVKYSMFNGTELATMDKVNANLGELCNKKIYCGEVAGTIVDGVISVRNPIDKTGNVVATMRYISQSNPLGCSITTQMTLSSINFYLRWHRESDNRDVFPPNGTEIIISYMIFY